MYVSHAIVFFRWVRKACVCVWIVFVVVVVYLSVCEFRHKHKEMERIALRQLSLALTNSPDWDWFGCSKCFVVAVASTKIFYFFAKWENQTVSSSRISLASLLHPISATVSIELATSTRYSDAQLYEYCWRFVRHYVVYISYKAHRAFWWWIR